MGLRRQEGVLPAGLEGDALKGSRRRFNRWSGRLIATACTVGWMGLIFYLSSSPPDALPRPLQEDFLWSGAIVAGRNLGTIRDVAGHLVLYGLLGPLLLVTLWSWIAGSRLRLWWMLVAIALGSWYGVLDEYHQSFVPGRSASVIDLVVDGLGTIAGTTSLQYLVALARGRGKHLPQP